MSSYVKIMNVCNYVLGSAPDYVVLQNKHAPAYVATRGGGGGGGCMSGICLICLAGVLWMSRIMLLVCLYV